MRVARGFNEGVVDPQHAAQSLRQVLFTLQKSRVTGGESREFADWSAYPGELVPDLIAWDKARRRFVGLTKQLDDVGFARADPKSRAMFRQLVRDTIAAIWKYTARDKACS